MNLQLSKRLLIEPILGTGKQFVFSPVSGLLDLATDAEVARMHEVCSDEGSGSDAQAVFAAYLTERGYAFESGTTEDEQLSERVHAAREAFASHGPPVYTVCPTLACNLGCSYCFEGDSISEKPQGVMAIDAAGSMFGAIDRLETERTQRQSAAIAAGAYQPAHLTLFGGEPLLPSTRRTVEWVVGEAAKRGMILSATTNGVNVTRFADLLTSHAERFEVMQITLDGPKAMHDSRRHRLGGQGTFDEIVRGISLLVELGISVSLRMNLDRQNLPTLPDLCRFIVNQGWTAERGVQMTVAPVTDHSPEGQSQGCSGADYGRAMDEITMHRELLAMAEEFPIIAEVCSFAHLRHLEHISSLIDERGDRPMLKSRFSKQPGPRYWYCEQGTGQQWVFTPDGLIYTCTEAVGKTRHAIGRFLPNLDIWQKQSGEWVGRTVLSHAKCRDCCISTLCGGGCLFAARERAMKVKARSAGVGDLLQIQVGGARRAVDLAAQVGDADDGGIEPFCANAEAMVREYLQTAGQRLLGKPEQMAAAA